MAYYGPKTVNAKGDTVYYSVPDNYFKRNFKGHEIYRFEDNGDETVTRNYTLDSTIIDTTNYPVYVILFLDNKLKKDGYKLEAFFDYAQYKPTEFKNVPVFFVSDYDIAFRSMSEKETIINGDFDSLQINLPSFHPLLADSKAANETYFKGKPYYVFNYFAVLVDKQRHIRGYYDPNQNSEVKRMIQEYKHLKTKDEYANTLKQNDLEQK